MYGHPTSCAKLILPAWTRRYPALRKALPTMWAVTRTDAARAALQRILDCPMIEQALRPLLPNGCSDRCQRCAAEILCATACAVDARTEDLDARRKRTHASAAEDAALMRSKGRFLAAEAIETKDWLLGGPPALQRPGKAMQIRLRYARSMLCHWAADPDSEPPHALMALLLTVAFQPRKPVTADSVRKFWGAERLRLGRK